jgi:hypothetical protein
MDPAEIKYVHLKPGDVPPKLAEGERFKTVLVIDCEVAPEWQALVSDWLVRSGCRYLMAWGHKCSEWHDCVDYANLAMYDFGEIPDDGFVVTTWHEDEPLREAFWFCGFCTFHPSLELEGTRLVHVAQEGNEAGMREAYRAAQVDSNDTGSEP